MTKDVLNKVCLQNLRLMFTIMNKTMTWQDWEVATPEAEKTEAQDIFMVPSKWSAGTRQRSKEFLSSLLLLDKSGNTEPAQNLTLVATDKLGWKVMCLQMNQIKLVIQFFKTQASLLQKGVSNLLDKIDYYDEDAQILTEKSILVEAAQCLSDSFDTAGLKL